MIQLDPTFQPAAPIVSVILTNPNKSGKVVSIKGMIDTGADVTAIPSQIVRQLGLVESRQKIVIKGIDGLSLQTPSYIVSLEFADTLLERRRVITWDEEFVVLGRDCLSDFEIHLDFKLKRFEVHDP